MLIRDNEWIEFGGWLLGVRRGKVPFLLFPCHCPIWDLSVFFVHSCLAFCSQLSLLRDGWIHPSLI